MMNREVVSSWLALAVLSSGAALSCSGDQGRNRIEPAPPGDICEGIGSGEEGGPQSRLYKGGCIENLAYFYAEDGAIPPGPLPERVKAVTWEHSKGGAGYKEQDIEIELVRRDRCIPGYEVPLYRAKAATPRGEINLCTGEAYDTTTPRCADEAESLRELAIAVPGAWEFGGQPFAERDGKKVFTLACATGVAAKCVHWGYAPWRPGADGTGGAGLYEACLQAARGEFMGDDTSYTCNGVMIDIFDRWGIRRMDPNLPGMTFEAAWGKDGIICVSHARYSNCDEDKVFKDVPRCDPMMAREDHWPPGVLIKTRSEGKPAPHLQCPSSSALCGA